MPWNELNAYWENTPKKWIAPMNMANWPDQGIYSNKNGDTIVRRYTIMLYYGILNIGMNDYMPKNNIEYLYCMITLLFSAILTTLFFGKIVDLVFSVSKKDSEY